jgi:hypothetical protein
MTYVTVHGPMFNGRLERIVKDFCNDWEREYAPKVEDAVQTRLASVLKHPTGNYQRHIRVRADGDGQQVDDDNIIYGPWLEGTGSRNFPKTRFKGYATFRRVAQEMDRRARPDANAMLRSEGYLRRMT